MKITFFSAGDLLKIPFSAHFSLSLRSESVNGDKPGNIEDWYPLHSIGTFLLTWSAILFASLSILMKSKCSGNSPKCFSSSFSSSTTRSNVSVLSSSLSDSATAITKDEDLEDVVFLDVVEDELFLDVTEVEAFEDVAEDDTFEDVPDVEAFEDVSDNEAFEDVPDAEGFKLVSDDEVDEAAAEVEGFEVVAETEAEAFDVDLGESLTPVESFVIDGDFEPTESPF